MGLVTCWIWTNTSTAPHRDGNRVSQAIVYKGLLGLGNDSAAGFYLIFTAMGSGADQHCWLMFVFVSLAWAAWGQVVLARAPQG